MELGSQICTPKNPHCQMCPWMKTCRARRAETIDQRPLKKPRKESEVWVWAPTVYLKNSRVLLAKNDYAPFLRGSWFLPGTTKKLETRPKRYDFRHSITHHDIFVQLTIKKARIKAQPSAGEHKWVEINKLHQFVPASLVKKAVQHVVELQNLKS